MCTMIVDLNPHYWQKTKMRRPLLVAGACFFCFLAALPMVTKGGMYVFQVIIKYQSSDQSWSSGIQTRTISLIQFLARRYIWSIRSLLIMGCLLWMCYCCLGLWTRKILQWFILHVWPQDGRETMAMANLWLYVAGEIFVYRTMTF